MGFAILTGEAVMSRIGPALGGRGGVLEDVIPNGVGGELEDDGGLP